MSWWENVHSLNMNVIVVRIRESCRGLSCLDSELFSLLESKIKFQEPLKDKFEMMCFSVDSGEHWELKDSCI